MERRVKVVWTRPARDKLAKLPPKIRRGILAKTRALADGDPRTAHKPLTGPLRGLYSIKVSRYRALYQVDEQRLPNGEVLILVRVVVVAVGMRKEGDKRDVYRLAQRLIRYADIESDHPQNQEGRDDAG